MEDGGKAESERRSEGKRANRLRCSAKVMNEANHEMRNCVYAHRTEREAYEK